MRALLSSDELLTFSSEGTRPGVARGNSPYDEWVKADGPFDVLGGEVVAWVDESGSNAVKDPGTYILSAVVCFVEDVEACRSQIRGLLLRGQKKVHWVDESAKRRRGIIAEVATLPVEHLIVVRSRPEGAVHPERRRKKCLERLLIELQQLNVHDVVFESRSPAQDRRDREMLDYLRTMHAVSAIRMHHRTGPSEPMLWVPDVCCGAVVEHRCGNSEYFAEIAGKATVHDI